MKSPHDITEVRVADAHVGATDVVPRDGEHMTPSEFHLRECKFHEGPMLDGYTFRFDCPPDGVTGRYLVVQLQLHKKDRLTLCEVTVAEKTSDTDTAAEAPKPPPAASVEAGLQINP